MQAFIADVRKSFGGDTPADTDKALAEFCQVLMCLNEFVYVD